MVNKKQYRIANNKKIMHKVGKHWVVLSAMALALLGVSYSTVLNDTNIHADTTGDNANETSTASSNATTPSQASAKSAKYQNVGSSSSAPQSVGTNFTNNLTNTNNSSSAKSSSSVQNITKQAMLMHQEVLNNATNNANFVPNQQHRTRRLGMMLDAMPNNQQNLQSTGTLNYIYNGKVISNGSDGHNNHGVMTSDEWTEFTSDLQGLNGNSDLNNQTFNNIFANRSISDANMKNFQVPSGCYIKSTDLSNFFGNLNLPGRNRLTNFSIPVSRISDITGNVAIHFITPTNDKSNFKYDKKSYRYVGKPITFPNVINGQNINYYNELKENGDSDFSSLNKAPLNNYNLVDTKKLISSDFGNQNVTHFDSDGETDNLYVLVQPKTEGTDYINYVRNGTIIKSVVNNTTSNPSDIDNSVASFKNAILRVNGKFRKLGKYNKNYAVPTNFYATHQKHFKNILKNDNTKYGQTQLNIPVKSVFSPITIHYVDANTGQKIMNDNVISDNSSSPKFSDLGNETQSIGNDWNINEKSSLNSNVNIQNYTKKPQSITLAYDFQNYNHPNNGKGDLDVFYFHNGSLQQYSDYGSFPDGTPLKSDAFTTQGFNIVKGNNINKFNNGTQTIVLTSNGNKTLQLPQTSDIIAPNAQDIITYKTVNGKVVGQWKSQMGYSNQSDEYFYNNYIPSDHPNLPEQYKLANNSSDDFNKFMHNKPNSDYGTNSFTFTVEPNQHTLKVQYVNAQNANQHIAPSDVLGDEIAGNSVNLPTLTNATKGFDLNSGHIIQVNGQNATDFKTMPDNDNTVITIGYNPSNITDNYQNTITINSGNGTNIKTISDNGANNNNWNFFEDGLKASQAEKAPFIFTNKGTEYMIPNYQNSDMNADVNTISDVLDTMQKQESTTINPFKVDNKNSHIATQTRNVKIIAQPLNTINAQFIDTSNGQHKVVAPNPNVANSDNALKVNNNTITDTGYPDTTQDLNSDTYTLPNMLSKYLPQGYELANTDDVYHIPTNMRENIIKNGNGFIEFNSDNANSAINFSNNPQNIQIAVKPIPKPQYSTITVHFLDGDKNNKEINPPVTTKGQVGSQFDLIADEDKTLKTNGQVSYVLNGVLNKSKNADSYEYESNPQTIDLVYSEIKGRIYINYIDRTMGNTVHTTTDTGLVGSPFNNDKSYLENIPSNYYFDGVSDNGVTNYSSVDQNINVYMKPVKPATAERTTITVNYVDKKSGKVVANAGTTSDSAGAPFDITSYVKNTPSDYHAVGFNNYTQNYGDSNMTVSVLVAKNAPKSASSASSASSTGSKASNASSTNSNSSNNASSSSNSNQSQINGDIYLNYRDVDSGTIIKSEHFTKPVGTTFDLDGYVRNSKNIPQGYELQNLDHVSGATNGFYYQPQTIDIYLTKVSNVPKQNQGIINISYVDAQTGKLLASDTMDKANANSAFNYNNNMKTFNNYTFDRNASKNLNINKFNNGTQYITLAYDENNCNITVEFIDNNGKVLKTIPTSAKANTPFNASDYKNDVPSGYEIKGSNSIVNMYDQHPQTYVFKVAKPSYHTITVNYIDKATGKTILTKSATNDADTPFDIDNYISYIPNGYKWDNMPNNTVSKFDNSNHTYSIILSAIKPIQPSSASAKPSSSASAKPSSASVAPSSKASSASSSKTSSSASAKSSSASTKSNSASSASVKPSSASVKPSSKASSASSSVAPSSIPSKASSKASSTNSAKSMSSASSVSSSAVQPLTPTTNPVVPSSVANALSSSASTTSSSVARPTSKAVMRTNKNYPVFYGKNSDKVLYHNRKYTIHYHANGANTITVKKGKHFRNVVVSTNLPIPEASTPEVVRAVDHLNFKRPQVVVHSAKAFRHALLHASANHVIKYDNKEVAMISVPSHWRYFMITQDAIAHKFIFNVGHESQANIRRLLRNHHTTTIFIQHIFAVHGTKVNYVRYEFKVGHHMFWITGRKDFTPNAYLQHSDFAKLATKGTHYVRVIHDCKLYNNKHYNKKHFLRNVHKGMKLPVAKVIQINAHKSYEQTRLVLADGTYLTANKNFVKIVK